MDKFKFIIFSIVVLALVGILGFWSFTSLQSGTEFEANQRIKELEEENASLAEQVADLTGELNILRPPVKDTSEPEVEKEEVVPAEPIVYKYQSLIDELQKLITDNISMKLKSKGSRVGTVQKFLNIYNNTTTRIDNDYGASTVKAITAFQKDEGVTADGQAGPSTFNLMIDWLKEQG